MRKAQGYNRWTTKPSHGVRRRRRMHVALQLLVLGIPIVLIITFAFLQFYNRLERLLDLEKSNQYQNISEQCADLLSIQLHHDQQHLVSLASSLSAHSEREVLAVLSALADPELSYKIGTNSTVPFFVQEGMVIFQQPFSFADGSIALLQRKAPAIAYQAQLECPQTQTHTTMVWADERGSIIWKFVNDELVENDKASLVSLVPSWKAGLEETTQILGNGKYVSIHSLGGDYGYFLLEREDTLLKRAYLTILQSSLSIAVLVMLILLVLLFFLIYRDHIYEKSLLRLAFEDELTGLPNKNHFVHEASQLLQRSRSPYAVIVIDIGKFKLINNQFGYTFGDTLLMYIAKILPRFTTQDGVCARLSGDKFILLCSYRERTVLEKRIAALFSELKQFSFPHASPFQLDILIGI
ncbi:MAG: GGDEF domain-containing protein, partial [Sphaerochaeta sp.]|nr:GGDEF domain-containing protein [Sphaerochaeta sp.]